ncbi:MAG: HAMP domain-containing protein, partial [Aeromicrobium sp.]
MSLRTRIAVITAIVVAFILALVGMAILGNIKAQVYDGVDQVVRLKAAEIADRAAASDLPERLPITEDPEYFVEVVMGGRLISGTVGLGQSNLFPFAEQKPGQMVAFGREDLPIVEEGPYRITAYGVETPQGTVTVFVATSVSDLVETLAEETRIGAAGLFVLMLIIGFVMWQALRRAIAPMDDIRAQADAITGANLHARVPEPTRLDEIGLLARTVNRMLDRLERNDERQRRFVADAAHELRSPIASLRVQLETSKAGVGVDGREDDLLFETMRMESLVDQLLLLARADAERSWLHKAPTDLDDV